jgi:hypothetical protein
MAEVCIIDGQQLTPTSFGETGDYGEWKPIDVSGLTFGTQGVYLPFKQDYTVEGFSTVTYSGQSGDQYIGGVGFQSDLTWIKQRNGDGDHVLTDSVRGVTKDLHSNTTAAEATTAEGLQAFNTDGFTLGDNDGNYNRTTRTYVAWNWDMGGSNATNTSGTITSTVRANATYGQSIVSWSGNGTSNATIGHGLSGAPEMVICKRRNNGTDQWAVYHASLGQGFLELNTTAAYSSATDRWGTNAPTSSVMNLGHAGSTNNGSGTYIAYMFDSVAGYSKFGTYTGNGSATGPTVTLGFTPAFVMIKNTSSTNGWMIFDSVRKTDAKLSAHDNLVEEVLNYMDFTSTGFDLKTTHSNANANTHVYIYMAFADKREYAYWLDNSGNNNDWTSNNLTESDISVDSPTNNFCTLNPLDTRVGFALSEGNTKLASQTVAGLSRSTFGMSTGKWYFEYIYTDLSGDGMIGIANKDASIILHVGSDANGWSYLATSGSKRNNNTDTSYGATYTTGDVIGVTFDADNGNLVFYKNNVSQGTAFTGLASNTYFPAFGDNSTGGTSIMVANFGQDSSFAGNKTAQGNQDGNSIGDFYYTPPTDFLALCTSNLPAVAVVPSEHFNTVLYTGNNTTNVITGVGFQADFGWWKRRNTAADHSLIDVVRGVTKHLVSNTTGADQTASGGTELVSFDTDGFTLGATNITNSLNASGDSIVSWLWKANGSGSANTNGDINSTVSVNTDAGFSIVSYTGNGSAGQTIGHGLSKAPEMMLIKNRSDADDWVVFVNAGSMDETDFLRLNSTMAAGDDADRWNDTAPTATVFTVDTDNQNNGSGNTHIAYCFHSVDGYSKVGSYTGNSNADGTFVYTGFQPSFVIIKRYTTTESWMMFDNAREPNNEMKTRLLADVSDPDVDNQVFGDFVSNGFKMRSIWGGVNDSSHSYIYIAFAETPFKYSNAR